jgi:outer membrane receptor for ferrienterochelin and colicins
MPSEYDMRAVLSEICTLGINANTMRYDRPTIITERDTAAVGQVTLLRRHDYAQRAWNRDLSLSPRVVWNLENGDTLSSQSMFSLSVSRQDTDDPVLTLTGPAPAYPVVHGTQDTRNHYARTDLNWVRTLASGLKIDLHGIGFALRQTGATHLLGYAAPAGAGILDDQVSAPSREHGITSTGKLSQKLGGGHAMVFGWDAGVTSGIDIRVQQVYLAADAYPGEPVEQYNAQVRRMAAYLQDEWTITPGWSAYLGVRWEGMSTAVDGTTIDSFTSRSGVWTPVFQTLYKLPDSKGDQLRLALTRTFKAPSLFRLSPRRNRSANNSLTEFDSQGNPLLRPETAIGLDLAYEHYWADGAMVSASASARAIDDYTRQDPFPDTGGRQIYRPINDGKARTRGLELEAKFPLRMLMDGAPAVDLRAGVSRNWSSVDAVPGPDNRVAQQTPLAASVGADYSGAVWSGGASFSYRSAGRSQLSPALSSWAVPRRDLDAYLMWKFAPKDRLRFAVNNLLSQDFHTERIYSDASGDSRRIWNSPASPSVRITLEMSW